MTREEHIKFCEKCKNRDFDPQKGIICSLTSEIATFEKECSNYILDESVKEKTINNTDAIGTPDIKRKLSNDTYERLLLEQNFNFAIIFGSLAALIGAVLWAFFTVKTGFQIGYMAIAVGAMVGFSIRYFGKGINVKFGFLGAVLSLVGCVLGNLFSIVGFISYSYNIDYFEVLFSLDFNLVFQLLKETFSFFDLFMYCVAIYEGYRFSFRKITQEDIEVFRKNEK
jgi:hypothetical protein